jgi:hypothetical protein
VGPNIPHPDWATDPSKLPVYGTPKVASTGIDWTSLAFMALWASIVLTVFVLWYRELRFAESLENGRPRMDGDDD